MTCSRKHLRRGTALLILKKILQKKEEQEEGVEEIMLCAK